MAMDERQLTAWLITHGVLQPGQVKETLEEQLRLERGGGKLDVLEVARRLGFVSDVQLLDVLERTGYTPAAKIAAPREAVSLAVPGRPPAGAPPGGLAAVPRDLVPPELRRPAAPPEASASEDLAASAPDASASQTGESVVLGDPDGEEAVEPEGRDKLRSSGTRRRPGQSSASHPAARRRRQDSGLGLIVAAGVVGFAAFVLFNLAGSGGGGRVDPGATGAGPSVATSGPTAAQLDALLRELEADVGRLAARGVPPSPGEQARLQGMIARLERERLVVSQGQTLARVKDQLAALVRAPEAPEPEEEGAAEVSAEQVDAAWKRLGEDMERILWLCLQQRRSPFQLAAEAARGKDLRRQIALAIQEHAAQGPEGIASLAGDAELHPILGVGGYDALLRELDRFPEALRESERGRRVAGYRERLETLRERAATYTRALLIVDEAAEQGDIAAARRAFEGGSYADDPWFKAMRELLARPDVAEAFARRAAGGDPLAGGPLTPRTQRRAGSWGHDWKERFAALAREHRRAKGAERADLEQQLVGVVEESLARARESFEGCAEVVAFYDEHQSVFKAAPALQPLLQQIHALYFEGALARATGPATLRALDRWCDDYGYEAWRARLKPFLRLVAVAGTPAARARERAREGRAQARAVVGEFAAKRLGTVADGLDAVIDWMRTQGYAPKEAKAELDALIARGVERAGDPVRGGQLREALRALEHTAADADAGSLAKGFRKQIDGVIDETVDRSLKAVEKCIAAGEPGLAFDLFQYVLLLDPENDRAHKGLGHVKVDGAWLRRFEAERLRAGFAWDAKLGWVLAEERARYEQGEYFDLQTKQWTTPAEASRQHAEPGSCWEVQTEHFLLESTADLEETTRVAERLEAFYLQLFRQYDLFFGAKGAALIFGVAASQSRPLVVNYYRSRDQFTQHASPPTNWAAGFYDGGRHASFFYSSRDWTTLQHEIVHQILGESSAGYAESWLAEGAAVYLEDAFFRDGVLTLGGLQDHSRVVAYQSNLRGGGAEHSLLTMVRNYRTSQQWDSGDIAMNYRGAGAVVYFLCTFDDGRFRSDFVEYLRAAYNGGSPKLEDYFGLPAEVLDKLMLRFYDPSAKVEPAGGAGGSAAALADAETAMVELCGERDYSLDQLTAAYAALRKHLPAAPEKEANKARSRAGKALASLRKKAAGRVEKAIKDGVEPKELMARWQRLQELQQAARDIINDTGVYPDANHGAAGQPYVDEKVKALAAFWVALPPVFDAPAVAADLELLEATEPWLDELEVDARRRGQTAKDLRDELARRAGCAGMAPTPEAQKLQALNAKVMQFNANLPGVPEDGREQVRILNEYRIMLGLHALAIDLRLVQTAAKHSAFMERAGELTHDEPDPSRATPSHRARLEGYNDPVGENVAFGMTTAKGAHDAWYTSSGHHRNMIHKDFHQVGVARSGTYWTQNFGMGKPQLP